MPPRSTSSRVSSSQANSATPDEISHPSVVSSSLSPGPSPSPLKPPDHTLNENVGLNLLRHLASLGDYHLWEYRREGRIIGYRVGLSPERTISANGYGAAVQLLYDLNNPDNESDPEPTPPEYLPTQQDEP